MRVLCYVSPWSADQYPMIAKGINKGAEIIRISSFKNLDQTGVTKLYAENLNKYKLVNLSEFCDKYEDMIKRCRILRTLQYTDAVRHIVSFKEAVIEVFGRLKPELVLSETTDSFVMDIIHQVSIEKAIPYIGLVISFINGYFRVSARGEKHALRVPKKEEIVEILGMLEAKSYKPQFVNSNGYLRFKAFKNWFRNIFRLLYFFSKRRIVVSEKYNLHYWGSEVIAKQWFTALPCYLKGNSNWQNAMRQHSKPMIYIPLQYIPEATVDYWCDINVIDYYEVLFEVIEKLQSDFCFVIKEHPNFLGLRSPKIYKRLGRSPSVIMCPTNINSNEILAVADSVLVWSGTVGFEAAIRGIPVLLMSKVYYMYGKGFKVLDRDGLDPKEVIDFIKYIKSEGVSVIEKQEMVACVLSGLLNGNLKNDNSWDNVSSIDQEDSLNIGDKLCSILSSIKINHKPGV